MNKFKIIISFLPFLLFGCTNVEPWERENLAKDHMAMDANPLLSEFKEHADFSREGTSGGYGLSGGGCGCN